VTTPVLSSAAYTISPSPGEGEIILRRSLSVLTLTACGLGVLSGPPATAAPPVTALTLTLFADQRTVAAGSRVWLSGTLRGTTENGNTIPLPGETVTVDDLTTPGDDGLKAVTRTDGSYTLTTSLHETGVLQAFFALPGVRAESARVRIQVLAKAVLHDFKTTYSPTRRFKATARLTLGSNSGDPATKTVALQFSPNGKSKWQTVTAARPTPAGKLSFGPFTHAPGWWRLRFPGDEHFAPSLSAVRKAWRWKTSFGKLSVTPRRVKVGKKVTFTGVLYRTDAKHPKRFPYARQKLAVIFLCGDTWRVAATGRTNAKGRFTIKAGTWCDARYQVVFDGTAKGDTLRAYSKTIKIDTKGRPLLK